MPLIILNSLDFVVFFFEICSGFFGGSKKPAKFTKHHKNSGLKILKSAVLGTLKMHKGPQAVTFLAFWKFIWFLWGAKTPYEINKHIVNIVF